MPSKPPDQSPLNFDVDDAQIAPVPVRFGDSTPISVSELNRRARNLIEAKFDLLWVSGELSNVIRAASGHWYFVLKDDASQVRCVMFRNRAAALGFKPDNGMQVDVRALPSLYEARGEFQLGVEGMRRAGLGALYEAFERLKAKLGGEGLFDETRKQVLPAFPRAIGIVTSLQAAALQDVLTTLRRRAPMIAVVLYPTPVQGTNAAEEIAKAIDIARHRREVDVLIVCRGGGSIEDLWSFNAEVVARSIARFQNDTSIPVVSGVGHETDFTICDFVADQRAPTPTAAAEMISPDIEQLRTDVQSVRATLVRVLRRRLDNAYQRVDHAQRRLVSPQERLNRERDRLAWTAASLRRAAVASVGRAIFETTLLKQRMSAQRPDLARNQSALAQRRSWLTQAMQRALVTRRANILGFTQALQLLAPDRVLERGYSIVEYNGVILRDSAAVRVGDTIAVRLARGHVDAEVRVIPLASPEL
ncbi:MAG: exodeoxyribonuclease VII large subunit [Burkholderiales bacterium]|nr:exodeoxyribonuclease VII large subunit [Burkholderiales bacterium]